MCQLVVRRCDELCTCICVCVRACAYGAWEPQILHVWLGDYVEELARWAVGLERAPQFVRSCLAFDRLPEEALEDPWVKGPGVITIGEDGEE